MQPHVCQSVCDAVYFGAQGRCRGLKVEPSCLYESSMALAVSFLIFRHICCSMYGSFTEKLNCRSASGIDEQRGHETMAIPDAAFLAVQFCRYTIMCYMKYDWPS